MAKVPAKVLLALPLFLGPSAEGHKLIRGYFEDNVVPLSVRGALLEQNASDSDDTPAKNTQQNITAAPSFDRVPSLAIESDILEELAEQADTGVCAHHGQRGYEISITADCEEEYMGSAQVVGCSGNIKGIWDLTGCVPQVCVTPTLTGYAVTEIDLARPHFNVSVACDADYIGTAQAQKCDGHGNTFSLSGCAPVECAAPSEAAKAGYVVDEKSLERPSFTVDVSCDTDYWTPDGEEVVATKCDASNEPYKLSGCVPEKCTTPKGASEYLLTENSLDRATFNVHAVCAPGYHGHPEVERCPSHEAHYKVKGCAAENCASPEYVDGYDFDVESLEVLAFQVSVTCEAGFHACDGGPKAAKCSAAGEPFKLSGCCPDMCASPVDQKGYEVTESDEMKRQAYFAVTAKCAFGYSGTPIIKKCSSNGEAYDLSGCTAESCTTPPEVGGPNGYAAVIEHDVSRDSFSVEAHCFGERWFGKAVATVCEAHGEPYKLSGCDPKVCKTPEELVTGTGKFKLVEEKDKTMAKFNVEIACHDHYIGQPEAHVCADHNDEYTMDGCEPVYYIKDGQCPPGEEINLPQECFIASDRLDIGESMSDDGILQTDSYPQGCFIKPSTNDVVGFNNKTHDGRKARGGVVKMVCSRRTSPIAMHYAALGEISDSPGDHSGGGVGYCKNHPTAEDCCQVWERITTYEQCVDAGRSLSYDVSNMAGPECIPGMTAGCFFSCPEEDSSKSCVRFNLDTPECSSNDVEVYQVKHICEKITTAAGLG
eukprot:gb/GFBE01036856.1/.p1 GENE.gb/GFBE01036856.1/~~gb/GFBE01036856.1/.p1  ORF type:complete len:766 (+),score=145.34 gb/GFBE01036856.1/:1-2298(+)